MIRPKARLPKSRLFVVVAVALALASCGKVGDLEPRTGQSLPPKAYGQKETQSAEVLSTPSVQARPGRSDELLRRSERRENDPFDLPPGEEPVPVGGATTETISNPKAE
ncbi:MAG: hypothetical protein ABI668_07605 [Sphingorhabdus sp.]